MSILLHTLSVLGTRSQVVERAWWSYLVWIPAAAVLGYAIAAIFSGWLHLPRSLFLVPYVILAGLFLYAYKQWSGVSVSELVRQNWFWSVIGTLLLGLFLVRNVLSQPASPRGTGLKLFFDLLWSGIVYGGMDALFLSVLPLLATRQAFTALGWAENIPGKILVGAIALLLSLFVTTSYHWGFTEYQAPGGLAGPNVGNGIMSLGYLLTSNPLTAVFSHMIMHMTGVLHGPASVMQLPPHY
ncbi:MAG: hypothetical protein EHM41_03125 [Chloroflexi bacterium]|nr:MAG: hypothetical protein EHM41_03125 [Chloroflexota bacterium]